MEKKFKETTIPETVSKASTTNGYAAGAPHIYRVATVLFHGISSCLGSIKNTTVPKAIIFKNIDGSFLAGAKVEYVPNEDDPSNPAAGRWDYTWTFYEEDLKGAECIDATVNTLIGTCLTSSALSLYNMRYESVPCAILLSVIVLETIKGWLTENAQESEDTILVLDGVFKASSRVVDGKIEMGIVPSGEMKVLIKNDSMIQEH